MDNLIPKTGAELPQTTDLLKEEPPSPESSSESSSWGLASSYPPEGTVPKRGSPEWNLLGVRGSVRIAKEVIYPVLLAIEAQRNKQK